jgi:hypothetical protein
MVKPKLHDASPQGLSFLHGKNHDVTKSCLLVGPFLHETTPALVVAKKIRSKAACGSYAICESVESD